MEMKIDLWFPTSIYYNVCPFHDEISNETKDFVKEIKQKTDTGGDNWVSKDLYNTCGTYNIVNDKRFNRITQWITDQVNVFASECQVDTTKNPYVPKTGWLNVYEENSWQDLHYHAGFTFSAIYCLDGNEQSSPVCFESPLEPDMKPLPTINNNELNYKSISYDMIPGRVLIFRSYVRHYVPKQQNNDPRITLAYNYDLR